MNTDTNRKEQQQPGRLPQQESTSTAQKKDRPSRRRWAAALLLLAVAAALPGTALLAHRCGQSRTLRVGVYAGSCWGVTQNSGSYQILDAAIERMEKKHPGLEITYTSGISPDEYSEWLSGTLLSGKAPDVFFVLPGDFSLLAGSGALLQLDDLEKQDPDFTSPAFYSPCLDAGRYSRHQYALPYESVPTMMFVNRTLLSQSGIDEPGNDWTWDDFYRICSQVSASGGAGERRFGVCDYTWQDALYANGTRLFSADERRCYVGGKRARAAVRFYTKLNALSDGYEVTSRDFDLGNVAFRPFLFSDYRTYQPYPWRVKKYSGFSWDCIRMPRGPEGGNVSRIRTVLLGISARTKNPQLSWELVRLLCADEALQKQLYTTSSGISPLQSVAEDPQILRSIFSDVQDGSGFDASLIHDIMTSAAPVPVFSRSDQAVEMADAAISEAVSSGTSTDSALLSVQRKINAWLTQ